MDLDKAMQMIDEALASLNTNRQTHFNLQEAFKVIKQAVKPEADKET